MLALLSEITKLLRILLTVPVTTYIAKRSFSALRPLKSYLRSAMTQTRLNNVTVLNVHNDTVQQLNIESLMDEFINKAAVRHNIFAINSIKQLIINRFTFTLLLCDCETRILKGKYFKVNVVRVTNMYLYIYYLC